MVAAIPFDLLIYRSGEEVVRGSGEGEVGRREGKRKMRVGQERLVWVKTWTVGKFAGK